MGELCVQVGERALQEVAMARVAGGFELLEHALAGQQQTLFLALAGDLGGSKWRLGRSGSGNCLSLLFLDRFALPSACHEEIIPAR